MSEREDAQSADVDVRAGDIDRTPEGPGSGTADEGSGKSVSRSTLWLVIGISLAAGLIGGVFAIALMSGASNPEGEGTEPLSSPPATEDESNVPPEAQFFVDAYPGVFDDPVATYFAETAYIENNGGLGVILGPNYAEQFESTTVPVGQFSTLGFEALLLPLDAEIVVETSVGLFNEAAPSMSRLLNVLAKNPQTDRQALIIEEFITYTGFQNQYAGSLVSKLQEVVNEFGSASNYSVGEAVRQGEESDGASVVYTDRPGIDDVDESGLVLAFNDTIDLSITIEVFDREGGSSKVVEVLEDVQFSVIRAPSFDPFGAGFIGVGIK